MGIIRESLKKILLVVNPTYRVARRLESEMEEMKNTFSRYEQKCELMFWQLAVRENETLVEAQKRTFLNLPKADGALRKLQLGSNCILQMIDQICKDNGITYWLAFGTLLGAVRHAGFIPWDDDVDIAMLRKDFEKLKSALSANNKLQIVPFYNSDGKWHIMKVTLKEIHTPFAIDIFIYDYADCSKQDSGIVWSNIQDVRDKLYCRLDNAAKLLSKKYKSTRLDPEDEAKLEAIYEYYKTLLPPVEQPDHIYRAIDTVYIGNEGLLDINDVFPLETLDFEGKSFPVMRKYEEYLSGVYNYLSFPPSSSYGHVCIDKLCNTDFDKALSYVRGILKDIDHTSNR